MQKITVDDIEQMASTAGDIDRRGLSDPLATSDLAMNYYALNPSEAFSGGLHTHPDQEELFYIIDGTATFETKPKATASTETFEVSSGEAVRFAPGEFQHGYNETDQRVVALALGAPKESTEAQVPQPCPECGESNVLSVAVTDGDMTMMCPECGAEVDAEI